jgi:hypothetical protein
MNQALTVISWHENLPMDEQPPRSIWHSGDLVDKWFKDVEDKRSAKYGDSGKARSSYEDADEPSGGMSTNELAESYRPK